MRCALDGMKCIKPGTFGDRMLYRSALYCNVCGGSLRITGSRCSNRCCRYCHSRYCRTPDHRLDVDRAREQHRARLLALMRGAGAVSGPETAVDDHGDTLPG